eukprot:2519213-Alexandrium_andersonii.AAC.1
MRASDFLRFGNAEKDAWPVGRAGTAAHSGWILDPELPLIRHLSDRLGVPTYEQWSARKCASHP